MLVFADRDATARFQQEFGRRPIDLALGKENLSDAPTYHIPIGAGLVGGNLEAH
jgi:hypothetical protein